jgi:two-component sensor histidine kinase
VQGEQTELWVFPEAESIPIALTLNELLTNAVKHCTGGEAGRVTCTLICGEATLRVLIANTGALPEGFNLARFPGGVSGLGLVRALLPRRSASLTLAQDADRVIATVILGSPGVMKTSPS